MNSITTILKTLKDHDVDMTEVHYISAIPPDLRRVHLSADELLWTAAKLNSTPNGMLDRDVVFFYLNVEGIEFCAVDPFPTFAFFSAKGAANGQ